MHVPATLVASLAAVASLVQAAPVEAAARDTVTIDVTLINSFDAQHLTVGAPLDGSTITLLLPLKTNKVDAVCSTGCRIGFHCILGGAGHDFTVGPGTADIIFDATTPISTVRCEAGFPATTTKREAVVVPRQAPSMIGINVVLSNSLLNTQQAVNNVPLDDTWVTVAPPFRADTALTFCAERCTNEFHCELLGPNKFGTVVGPGTTAGNHELGQDSAAVSLVRCAPGLPSTEGDTSSVATRRQEDEFKPVWIDLTNTALAQTETLNLGYTTTAVTSGLPGVDLIRSSWRCPTGRVCILEYAYHCDVFDTARALVGTTSGTVMSHQDIELPEGTTVQVGSITCVQDPLS